MNEQILKAIESLTQRFETFRDETKNILSPWSAKSVGFAANLKAEKKRRAKH